MMCLKCAIKKFRSKYVGPCAGCVSESRVDRRAEVYSSVAKFAREWDAEIGLPRLDHLPTSHLYRALWDEEEGAKKLQQRRDYMREYKRAQRAKARKEGVTCR